ncbi:MAG: EamA family transporter [Candidatus Coproplasma sp.]
MWVVFALLSAFFASVTSILAKCGIKNTPSNLATAIRTIVVLLFAWVMALIVGSYKTIVQVDAKSWIFLVLSGIATGASWLCYFKALQLGDVNKVVPIDKSSTVLTLLLSFIIFQEAVTAFKWVGVVLIAVGTFLMITKKAVKDDGEKKSKAWIVYALLSAVFASAQAILSKLGIDGVESNLGTAIRTCVVLVMAWIMVFATKEHTAIKKIDKKELIFILLSGLATGASWLCYYKAMRDGVLSAVVAIDKLSILITIAFSFIVFKEKLSLKAGIGLTLVVGGTVCMLF